MVERGASGCRPLDGDTTELWAALQMVLMLEKVEYQMKEAAN